MNIKKKKKYVVYNVVHQPSVIITHHSFHRITNFIHFCVTYIFAVKVVFFASQIYFNSLSSSSIVKSMKTLIFIKFNSIQMGNKK